MTGGVVRGGAARVSPGAASGAGPTGVPWSGSRSPSPVRVGARQRIVDAVVARRPGSDRSALDRDLALALRMVASSTRAGMALGDALADAGTHVGREVGDACRAASGRMRLGYDLRDALQPVVAVGGGHASRLLADVLAVRQRRGGDLGELCHRLSVLLHDRYRLDREVRSLTAQARFSARAVVAMPVVAGVGWAIIAPASLQRMLTPGMALLLAPAFLLLALGAVVVRRIASGTLQFDRSTGTAAPTRRPRRVGAVAARIAGTGPTHLRSARLLGAAAVLDAVVLLGGATRFTVGSLLTCTACAAAWPFLDERRARTARRESAIDGAASLLELSLALLSAGTSPRVVVLESARRCDEPLRGMLAAACARVDLGRSPAAAFGALPILREVPELEAWLLALVHGDRHGAPADVALESLLRDVRTAERERIRSHAAIAAPRMQLAVVLLVVPAIMWIVLTVAATGLARELTSSGILG